MIWAMDRDGSNIRKLTITKGEQVEVINGEQSLNITTTDEIKKYDTVIFKNMMGDWQEFIAQGVDKARDGSEVYLEHSSYELHDNVVRDKRQSKSTYYSPRDSRGYILRLDMLQVAHDTSTNTSTIEYVLYLETNTSWYFQQHYSTVFLSINGNTIVNNSSEQISLPTDATNGVRQVILTMGAVSVPYGSTQDFPFSASFRVTNEDWYTPTIVPLTLSGRMGLQANSVVHILQQIVEGTRWSAGTSDINGVYALDFYYITSYEALKKLVEATGGELEFVYVVVNNQVISRTINIKSALGADRGRIFTYSKDLFGVRRSINDDIITALIGRGKSDSIHQSGSGERLTLKSIDMPDSPLGVDYVEDVEAKNNFGLYFNGNYMHRYGMIEFDDIEDANELYLETKRVLAINTKPHFTYEVSLAMLDKPEDRVSLGDVIYIIDPEFGEERLNIYGRIIKIKHDLLYPENSEIVVGNVSSDMSYFQKRIEAQMDVVRSKAAVWDKSNVFNHNNELPASYISNLLGEWNTIANLTGGFTYVVQGKGTITYDRPEDQNPTQAVQIVGGTLRIANSKTIDGEWIWRTVINAEGVSGDEIITGSVTTSKLASDVGEELNIFSNEAVTTNAEAISEISGRLNTAESRITPDAIINTVRSSPQYGQDFSGIRSEIRSSQTQTADSFNFEFTKMLQTISTVDGKASSNWQEIVSNIRFKVTPQGVPYIEIGHNNSNLKLVLLNDEIQFMNGPNKVAYISNNMLHITDGEFLNSLKIGSFAFKPRSNGSLSFGKVG